MTPPPHFPDILGTLTGGARLNVGVIQVALGARPTVVAAGRPFELLVVLQNASDSRVEVALTPQLPRQFRARNARLVVSVGPAEAGYVTLPVAALPDTGHGAHRLGVDVEAKAQSKSNRVRDASGGQPAQANDLPFEKVRLVSALRQVTFSASKRMLGNVLEVEVSVGAVDAGAASQQAGWVSLWSMADLRDERQLLRYAGEALRYKVLPGLKREHTVAPLQALTDRRFADAGYPLKPAETLMIAKLMALVLEYGAPRENSHSPLQAGRFDLTPALSGSAAPEQMPRWARGMLRAVAGDERLAGHAVSVVTGRLFDDLLLDALMLAFALVEKSTGEDVGSQGERDDYANRLAQSLRTSGDLDFIHVYMPLVMGGIVINDQIVTADTNMVEALRELWLLLDERRRECEDPNHPVVEITEQLIERALEAYGYRRGST